MKQREAFVSLTSKKQISRLFKEGRVFKSKSFLVRYLTKSQTPPEVLLAVSKKIGKSNERNKIKRRLRAALFEVLKYSPEKPAVSLAIIPRRSVLTMPFGQLVKEVTSCMGKL